MPKCYSKREVLNGLSDLIQDRMSMVEDINDESDIFVMDVKILLEACRIIEEEIKANEPIN